MRCDFAIVDRALQSGEKRCSIPSGAATRVSRISVPVWRVDRGPATDAVRGLAVFMLSGFRRGTRYEIRSSRPRHRHR